MCDEMTEAAFVSSQFGMERAVLCLVLAHVFRKEASFEDSSGNIGVRMV